MDILIYQLYYWVIGMRIEQAGCSVRFLTFKACNILLNRMLLCDVFEKFPRLSNYTDEFNN